METPLRPFFDSDPPARRVSDLGARSRRLAFPGPEPVDPVPRVSIVLPVFEEEESLRPLLREIRAAMDAVGDPYEIVAVDDGSGDGSLAALRAAAADCPGLRVLSTPRRSGQSAALAAGFRASRGAVVVTLDADLQNDPGDIPRLLEVLEGDCDMVSGVRETRRDDWLRRLSSRLANGVRRRVLDDGIHDVGCSLKAYRREVLVGLPAFDGMHRFLPALVGLRGARVREIGVGHRPRRHGRSKYGVGNRLWRGLADLAGVWWLRRRWVDLEPYQESDPSP
jgi:glycosyltransferase involved in cell wall biosynthesis